MHDMVDVLEGKQVFYPNDAAQVVKYLNQLPSGSSRAMMFDKTKFMLLQMSGSYRRKEVVSVVRGDWVHTSFNHLG